MSRHSDIITVEHRIGKFGYKLVKNNSNSYDLIYLSDDDEIEYDNYKSLQKALDSAQKLLDFIRNP